MDSSRRAVEAYWRSRTVDALTSDDDKVAPVYKLDELCDLLRSSHPTIVKELSDYILKRLDHKSPLVKHKALRVIKYAVAKSGTEFRKEMQRHSIAMRQLFHYKGHPDPLKGDSLNKAVRDSAHEAVAAVFASDDSKAAPLPVEGLNNRIQGFGNTNFDPPAEEKKSFISEVVGMSSASIKQGFSSIAAAHTMRKADSDGSSYKSPTLRRSLTTGIDRDSYGGDGDQKESWVSSGVSRSGISGTWSPDMRTSSAGSEEKSLAAHTGVKSREERLLETVVTSGGVRLQPTRDALQAFLTEASKLDAVAMSRALETKLQSHLWQVRMKAVCVLESILRKKHDDHFSVIASYFSENRDLLVKCSELPQVSLREKACKVLILLEGDQNGGATGQSEEQSIAKAVPVPVQMPDLIDTGDPDDHESEVCSDKQNDENNGNITPAVSLVDDLLGSGHIDGQTSGRNGGEYDPFADVLFHVTEDKGDDDIFSGLAVDDKRYDIQINASPTKRAALADVFSHSFQHNGEETNKSNIEDLITGLDLKETANVKQPGSSGGTFPGATFLDRNDQQSQPPVGAWNGLPSFNTYPLTSMQHNMPQNIMLNQAFSNQPMNYGAVGALFAQQQLLFQNLGSLNSGFVHTPGNAQDGGYTSALPDIFQVSNNPVQRQGMMDNTKKEEIRAFDFIADHVSAARDSKRVL